MTTAVMIIYKEFRRKIYARNKQDVQEKAEALEIGIKSNCYLTQYFDPEMEKYIDLTDDVGLFNGMEIRLIPKLSKSWKDDRPRLFGLC